MTSPAVRHRGILSMKPKDALAVFVDQIRRHGISDADRIGRLAAYTTQCIQGDAEARARLERSALMQHWYQSLSSGRPDYGIYDSPLYLAELWACWAVFSRKYLLSIHPARNLPPLGIAAAMSPVRRIVDLGCGCGYTTASFCELFPDAEVIGTNISGSIQYRIASEMASTYGFRMVPGPREAAGETSLVFASEYFEHILDPIAHLKEVVASLRPRFMMIANAFGTVSIGHFHEHVINGNRTPSDKVSRVFSSEMKRLGYAKLKTKLWNNRPSLWKRATGA
jgi:SAM-dependent methyltransferase